MAQPSTHLGIKIAKSSKDLGVITGYDSSMAKKAIAEQEARIYRQIDAWDHKNSHGCKDYMPINSMVSCGDSTGISNNKNLKIKKVL
jgi:hypothetical protein